MTELSKHIYMEGDKFFFDSEVYAQDGPVKMLDYEDGDRIKWSWNGKTMTGVLRDENSDLGLFQLENVTVC